MPDCPQCGSEFPSERVRDIHRKRCTGAAAGAVATQAAAGIQQPPAQLCQAGEAADGLLAAGQAMKAVTAYMDLLEGSMKGGKPDALILAKSVLGLMIALIHANRVADAHMVWTSKPPAATGYGIQMIESGQTSGHDAMVYMVVSGFLHSLSTGDKDAASLAVDRSMKVCFEHALERDPASVPGLLNNWRRNLLEVHGGAPQHRHQTAFNQAVSRWGKPVPEGGLYWPRPHRWIVDW